MGREMNCHLEVAIALVVRGPGQYILVWNRVRQYAVELDSSCRGMKIPGRGVELLQHSGQILCVCGPKRQNGERNER
jgi:hypothetical protein